MNDIDGLVAPWPWYAPDERAAVDSVLASGKVNYWTGKEVRSFEAEYAAQLGVAHAIAVANGTLAMELALRAWSIGEGDEVIVTPRSFIASASCVVLLGARPVFVDVDRDSGNMSVAAIESAITSRTRAIVVVHLAGWPADMDGIMALARQHDLKVLEDCAQAHGATYRGKPVGSMADAGAFSFCQDKIISTGGEGGLLVTDDQELWDRAWSFKDHGKTQESMFQRHHEPGFRWVHDRFGTNFRLTELQAAIGRIQLGKLPEWVEQRRRNAGVLVDGLRSLPALRIPEPPSFIRHAYYRLYAYVDSGKLRASWSRDRVVAAIVNRGVPCFFGSCSEIYRERAFEGTTFAPTGRLPVARELGETSLAFLVHPTLGVAHMERSLDIVRTVLNDAVR